MKSARVALALSVFVLLSSGTVRATCGSQLEENEKAVLLTNEKIFNLRHNLKAIKHAPTELPSTLAWNALRPKLEAFLQDDECIKSLFNNKNTWRKAHKNSKAGILLYLHMHGGAKGSRLGLLKLDNLTDVTCRGAIAVAAKDTIPNDYPFTEKHFEKFHSGCWFYESTHALKWPNTAIKHIPKEAFDHPLAEPFVFSKIGTANKFYFIKEMTGDQFKSFFEEEPSRCASLGQEHAAAKPDHGAHLTAECLSNIRWIKSDESITTDLKDGIMRFLRFVPPEAFSRINTLNEHLVPLLSEPQVKQLDAENPVKEIRCAGVPIEKLSKALATSLDADCIAGRINNTSAFKFGSAIERIADDGLSKVNFEDVEHAQNVVKSIGDAKYIKKSAHWKTIFEGPVELCRAIAEPTPSEKISIELWPDKGISSECFVLMNAGLQTAILSTSAYAKKLADDALARFVRKPTTPVSGSSDAYYDPKWTSMVTKSAPTLFRQLGALVPAGSLHPCSEFDVTKTESIEKGFLLNAGTSCIRSFTNIERLENPEQKPEEVAKINKALLCALDIEKLLALRLAADFFSSLTLNEFASVTAPSNCGRLTATVVGQIPASKFVQMLSECYLELTVPLSREQHASLDAVKVFGPISKTSFPRIKTLALMTEAQVAALSTKVQPPAHAARAFTKETLAAWGPTQTAQLSEVAITAMPDEAAAGLGPTNFVTVKPESLIRMSCSKAKQLPAASLLVITPTQAASLGKLIPKREESARCVYTSEVIAAVADEKAREVLQASASSLKASMAVVVVSAIIGLLLV